MSDEHPQRILIVDDDLQQVKALCDTLTDLGYHTTGFTAAVPALAALEEGTYDLVLADLVMPGTDGIALLKAAIKLDPNLVGIIMTGEGTIATAVDAMQSGALDYILKPFKLSAIVPVLTRAIAMRKLRMDNATLHQRLRERAGELEAINSDLDAFTASVSHDLRAPLRGIAGFADLLEQRCANQLDDEGKRFVRVIQDQAAKMRTLIDDLLAFCRLGRSVISTIPVDTTKLVQQVLDDVRQQHFGPWPAVTLDPLPESYGDKAMIQQVWINLVSNAVKYSARVAAPHICISGRVEGEEVVFKVQDNGAGFDMKHYDKLFGVFQRLHGDRDFAGSGIGLATVKQIVSRHRGRVWAQGEPGEGATFYFSLPIGDGRAG